MPNMDGFETASHIKRRERTRHVPILFLTAADRDAQLALRGYAVGAVDYLAKPFAIAELVERVKRRVDEHFGPTTSRWLDAGGVRLDLQRRQLRFGDRVIALSQREFILLSHLMRHAGEVCSRDQLLAEVWGYSFDPGSNVVDVCVRRLRTKLEKEFIETVRNVGYCFVAS
jgi:two-component system, OmpR family, response regulator